ncbi:RNA polymerase sigma factor [Telmatocola sphagniphila]|uniref:RNA polymerase sigma factor n=1 Tax=Telmatocola sphagniphila TaxID=1123043 RepID=A0A8E6B6H6_9BACT|nr:RNA polymerase sigma factor [Telmatocola sphagniphila]QVL32184.1 RNA polymerase sigma factor [Telmatocola sphagniphila]
MTANELGSLIDRLAGPLSLYARQWVDSPEDIVQEAFLRLVAKPPSEELLVPWLYRVVRNAAIDSLKMSQRRKQREQKHAQGRGWFVEQNVEGLDAEVAVNSLKGLPLEQREIIVAHLWGGLTFEQIAKLTDSSSSTVHRSYQAGLAELRVRLEGLCPMKPKS